MAKLYKTSVHGGGMRFFYEKINREIHEIREKGMRGSMERMGVMRGIANRWMGK